jgi:glyoxylase-like metal-dependent hydrolase (beta-lactamase superfamily II)
MDHAGGAGTITQKCPQLQVLVHERGARHLIDPSRLIKATRDAFGPGFEEAYGPILSLPERQVRVVNDGDIIQLGERELKIIYAPGHASHQMCIYDMKNKGIFSGEALGTPQIGNRIVEPVAGFDLDAAIETIDKLSQLDLLNVFCSHGGICREPGLLIDSVRMNTKTCGDIIFNAMKAGEGKEMIARRLKTYQTENTTGQYQSKVRDLEFIIPWYLAHFQRKNVAKKDYQ